METIRPTIEITVVDETFSLNVEAEIESGKCQKFLISNNYNKWKGAGGSVWHDLPRIAADALYYKQTNKIRKAINKIYKECY